MILEDILKSKKEEIKNLKPLKIKRKKEVLNVVEFLKEKPIIAEIKKASPSKGVINKNVNILKQAKIYEKYGAGAISVLTDRKFFSGNFEDLKLISENINLPVLCKDFILSEVQIENAYRCGADFILLIVCILNETEIERLYNFAKSYGLEVLFEIHDYEDFLKIKKLKPNLVGVNSRNFKNMKIEKERACEILKKLKGDFLKIAESGIESKKDIEDFKDAGADSFLIGTSLMKAENLEDKFKKFYSCL